MRHDEFQQMVQTAIDLLESEQAAAEYGLLDDRDFYAHISAKIFKHLDLRDVETVQLLTLDGPATVDQSGHLQGFIDSSKNVPEVFDALLHRAAFHLERGDKLHPDVAIWLARVLRGEAKKRSRQGRPSVNSRDALICKIVQQISELIDQVLRSESGMRISALEVVNEALSKTKIAAIDYDQIKDIWEKFQRERITILLPDVEV